MVFDKIIGYKDLSDPLRFTVLIFCYCAVGAGVFDGAVVGC